MPPVNVPSENTTPAKVPPANATPGDVTAENPAPSPAPSPPAPLQPAAPDAAGSVVVEPVSPQVDAARSDAGERATADGMRERVQLAVSYPHTEAAVVTVGGEIDAATVEYLEETLWNRLTAAVRIVVVDLTGLDFLAVTGLQLLNQALLRARSRDVDLRIAAGGHEALHGLRVAGLGALCHPNTADALAQGPSPAMAVPNVTVEAEQDRVASDTSRTSDDDPSESPCPSN